MASGNGEQKQPTAAASHVAPAPTRRNGRGHVLRVPSSKQKRMAFRREVYAVMATLMQRAVNTSLADSQGLFQLSVDGRVKAVFALAAVGPHEEGSTSRVPVSDGEAAWNSSTWLVGNALEDHFVTASELCSYMGSVGLEDISIEPGDVRQKIYPGWQNQPRSVWIVSYTFPAEELAPASCERESDAGSGDGSTVASQV